MQELFKKTILAGLGLVAMTKEKAEDIANDLIKRGELAKTEEAKFVKDIMEKAEKNKKQAEKRVEEIVGNVLEKLDIPTRKDINELKTKIEKLDKSK